MLDPALSSQLKTHLENLRHDLVLESSLDDSPKSSELGELLDEIAALTRRITHARTNDDPRRPSFTIRRAETDIAVRFAGIPMGHEFTSLVLALLHVGGHPSKETIEVLEQAAALPDGGHFETFFSLSCQNCPDVVQALNLLSVINPKFTHTAIDGAVFPDEAEDRGVLSVPTVFRDGEMWGSGRMTFAEIVDRLDDRAPAREVERLNAADPYDVLVIGGGPAGVAAAVYAARKGIRTGMLAESVGGQVLDTMAIENLISVRSTTGPALAAALTAHVDEYAVEVTERQRVSHISEADNTGHHTVSLDSGATLRARSVVVATGARWRAMDVPGEQEYRNAGVTYCPHCDGPLFAGKRVAVIGGGNSGIEAAIDLAGVVAHVTVLEFDHELRADEVLQRKLRSLTNVEVITSAATTSVNGDGDKVTGLSYTDRTTNTSTDIALDGVFVQIGLLPNTEWLEGTLELNSRGEIIIDDRGATSLPGVFAAGDCTTVPYKQIVISMGAGATAALAAFDHLIRSDGPNLNSAEPSGALTPA